MAIIKNENGEEIYTNSEYYDKKKSDNTVIFSVLLSIVVGIIFYSIIYHPFFAFSSDSLKQTSHYGTTIAVVVSTILWYRAFKLNTFFTGRVIFLPIIYMAFLSVTFYMQSVCNESLEKDLELKEFAVINKLSPGTLLPKKELKIEFKDKKDRDCHATLSVKFLNKEAEEKSIAILNTNTYICLSKGVVLPTIKDGKLEKENGSYVGNKDNELYLAYKDNDKYKIGHKLNIFTKKIDEQFSMENISNYIGLLEEKGQVYFELDKNKVYVLVYHTSERLEK